MRRTSSCCLKEQSGKQNQCQHFKMLSLQKKFIHTVTMPYIEAWNSEHWRSKRSPTEIRTESYEWIWWYPKAALQEFVWKQWLQTTPSELPLPAATQYLSVRPLTAGETTSVSCFFASPIASHIIPLVNIRLLIQSLSGGPSMNGPTHPLHK